MGFACIKITHDAKVLLIERAYYPFSDFVVMSYSANYGKIKMTI